MRSWPRSRRRSEIRGYSPAATARPRYAVFVASASHRGDWRDASGLTLQSGRGLGGCLPRRRAGRRQLRQHDADARRHPGRPPFLTTMTETTRSATAHAARDRALERWGPYRVGGWPTPLSIQGAHCSRSSCTRVPSAQVKTAVLLAGLHANGVTTSGSPGHAGSYGAGVAKFGVRVERAGRSYR